ncbi:MAG: lysine--tRNA ligase [Alphaproteobacteria bacterium GM7ARS4]|nr:lysine--tRNA ligase [Alphaproteobacteria bacterium GM7ARS4]
MPTPSSRSSITPSASPSNTITSTAWPFQEARRLLTSLNNKTPPKGYVLFATGYGPSGLPHIGTFAEVVRTTMVQNAWRYITDIPCRLFTFSDDMDALRRVPSNVPQQTMLTEHLGKPLATIPDPYERYGSFGEHNNAMLKQFLDSFGFSYQFQSAYDNYTKGLYDPWLKKILARLDDIRHIILPTLGHERQQTYSPFQPICPHTGHVLHVPVIDTDRNKHTISYIHPKTKDTMTCSVLGGACKLQWKVDWAMRWVAMDVNYEMAGKDLTESYVLSSKIARLLKAQPPQGFIYELFLDAQGEKISKSKGNGVSIDEWLTYAPPESLSFFMYQHPKRAKKLSLRIIPSTIDHYLKNLHDYAQLSPVERLNNPVWHVHAGTPPPSKPRPEFSMILNLATASHADHKDVLWGFIRTLAPDADASTDPLLATLIEKALVYYKNFVKPYRTYRTPNEQERKALTDLLHQLKQQRQENAATYTNMNAKTKEQPLTDPVMWQNILYALGKQHMPSTKEWFTCLYQTLLGQDTGPRMGSFIALYGVSNMITLVERALARTHA